jgi:hypothetical protein
MNPGICHQTMHQTLHFQPTVMQKQQQKTLKDDTKLRLIVFWLDIKESGD